MVIYLIYKKYCMLNTKCFDECLDIAKQLYGRDFSPDGFLIELLMSLCVKYRLLPKLHKWITLHPYRFE